MTAKNRKTLHKYFKSGSLPSEDQFKHLIDSMLNMRDEGFEKTAQEGFKVAQLSEKGKLISFFENIPIKTPAWSVKIDQNDEDRRFKLTFLNDVDGEILTLTPDGKVGIIQNNPDFELDVAGTIASRGRIGEKGAKDLIVHANGHWQDITDHLEGCHAFEIMAGVGKPKSGKYALLHAFALNTFNAKGGILNRRRKIVYHQAHYGSRCNRLKLKWKRWGKGPKYTLQLKTGCAYDRAKDGQEAVGKEKKDVGVYVKYYITKLWFDKKMKDCLTLDERQPSLMETKDLRRLSKERILSRIRHKGAEEEYLAKLDQLSKNLAWDLVEDNLKKESELKKRIAEVEVLIKGQKELEDFSYNMYHYTGLDAKDPDEYLKEEKRMEASIYAIYDKIKAGLC